MSLAVLTTRRNRTVCAALCSSRPSRVASPFPFLVIIIIAVVRICSCKEHNWYEFLTSTAVDLFIKHIKLYRKAQKKLDEELKAENKSSLVMSTIKGIYCEWVEAGKRVVSSNERRQGGLLRSVGDLLLMGGSRKTSRQR